MNWPEIAAITGINLVVAMGFSWRVGRLVGQVLEQLSTLKGEVEKLREWKEQEQRDR